MLVVSVKVIRTPGAVCAFLLSIFACMASVEAQTYEGKILVNASLVADTTTIAPGKPFRVGVLLRMAKGWHTYWKYSGDAGIPSEIKWQLPPGWKASEIEWPIPLKLKDPGDIITYGYSDEVLLMQEITPPAKFDNAPTKLSADVNWLVCERLCIPGSAKLDLTVPGPTTSPASAELLARYRKRLPATPDQTDGGNSLPEPVLDRSENQISFRYKNPLIAKYAFADFFPLPDEKTVVGHTSAEIHSDELSVRVPFETEPPKQLRGLIVLGQNAADESRIGWYLAGGTSGGQSASNSIPASTRGLWTWLGVGVIVGVN
jgi:DsbC/DsbD-like thiol-disulfide interchange protein